jgi:putative endonuclease
MFYVYILKSTIANRLYKGSTSNLETRLDEHNSGKVRSTKPYRPWRLIYYEAHRDKKLAQKAELFYKTGQGRRQLKKKSGFEK